MARPEPSVLEAPRLPELLRAVCAFAGTPAAGTDSPGGAVVVHTGEEPPGFLAKLLEEAVAEDGAAAAARPVASAAGDAQVPPGRVAVLAGFGSPCPDPDGLRRAAAPAGGRALLFALERHAAAGGGLLGVTWAALPEAEPAPQENFRPAVLREGMAAAAGAGRA
jgi:hypothetical protein